MHDVLLNLTDYDYAFLEEQIALAPASPRDSAALWVSKRNCLGVERYSVRDLPEFLAAGDCLVLNDVSVLPVRLQGRRKGEGLSEVLLTSLAAGAPLNAESGWIPSGDKGRVFEALISRGRKIRVGTILRLGDHFELEVLERCGPGSEDESEGQWRVCVHLLASEQPRNLFAECGAMPLPPYIRKRLKYRREGVDDFQTYQSVFAAPKGGGVAAPTAGLHFTPELLTKIKERGVEIAFLTLYISFGTFRPIRHQDLRRHRMHHEHFDLPLRTVESLKKAKSRGAKIIAVGTTVTRTLEAAARDFDLWNLREALVASTGLFITPGFQFKVVDHLLTNFHQPKSSLLLLTCAFGGREAVLENYRRAIAAGCRLFSYGDATLMR